MKRADKFVIPSNWKVLFNDLGINIQVALSYAELPLGLFEQKSVQLSPSQYFQLWRGIDKAAKAQDISLALKFAEVMSLEAFDVPIFAAICSRNLNSAIKRLQEYKPLIGPMVLDLNHTETVTEIILSCYGSSELLPKSLNLTELVFFTQLTRLATRQNICPVLVELPELPSNLEQYKKYFGCQVIQGEEVKIVFSTEDAEVPFLTDNQTMLAVLEGDIHKKLDSLAIDNVISKQVFSHLMEMLPQGESSIEVVASRMAMSKRTLQRKLSTEKTSYQAILHKVREELAHYYLKETKLPINEVSFLLGFQESNSFIRAYNAWTGISPSQARNHSH